MPDQPVAKHSISPEDANTRWEQSLSLVSTFVEIWLNNPQLARQAGVRVEEFVMPRAEVQRRHALDLV